VDWVRAERRLVRTLGALIKWGWVAYDESRKKKATSSGIMPTGRPSWHVLLYQKVSSSSGDGINTGKKYSGLICP